MRQLRLAFRTLFKSPFVTAIAILSLALGIGANAAIFSLFDQILLQPLPVREPEQLVNLKAPGPKPGSQSCSQAATATRSSATDVPRPREEPDRAHRARRAPSPSASTSPTSDQPINGDGLLVSGSYFPTLGIQPCHRPAAHPRRRSEHRRPLRDRARQQLLAVALRLGPVGGRADHHHQRPVVHHRGRHPGRFRGHHARRAPATCTCRSPCAPRSRTAQASSTPNRRKLLGVSVRAPQAGRHDRPGETRAERGCTRRSSTMSRRRSRRG